MNDKKVFKFALFCLFFVLVKKIFIEVEKTGREKMIWRITWPHLSASSVAGLLRAKNITYHGKVRRENRSGVLSSMALYKWLRSFRAK